MKIDVHNHFYPLRFLERLQEEGPAIGITMYKDEWGRQVIAQHDNRIVTITPPMTDVERRMEDMDRAGVDIQILTLSAPSVEVFPPEMGRTMAKLVNDEFAEICTRYPNRFKAFATLPFLDPEATVEELERCIEELNFCGTCIGTNLNGLTLDDELLYPFYERMAEYKLPIHIHPRAPADKRTYKDYRLGPMIGFEMEICVAAVRLIMGGVLERFPGLRFIVSHLGGALPYLAERIGRCYEAYPECQEHLSRPAKEYLRDLYYDTVSFFEPALMCAYSFLGAERLVLGSDYPHVIGDIHEAVASIERLGIPPEEKELIFSGNILRLIQPYEGEA